MNEEELKRLLAKYYSGESTEEEEIALRNYFIENSAPPGYEAEKEIFSFYIEEINVPEPSSDLESKIIRAIGEVYEKSDPAKARKLIIQLISAAAGVLIIAGSYFFFNHRNDLKDTYNNPEIAYMETVRILNDVSYRMNKGTQSLKQVGWINDMQVKSFKSINKSAILVERNLKSLMYLRTSTEINSTPQDDK